MAAFDVIRLDTAAPVVEWGAPVDANASEEMSVPYAVDEPEIESATIQLLDGRVLAMDVFPTILTVTLPDDSPEGAATVRAHVIDDVGNEAIRELVVAISGVPPVVEPAPHGEPHPMVTVRRRSFLDDGHAAVRSTWTTAALAVTTSRLRPASFYAGPVLRMVSFGERAEISSSWTLGAQMATPYGVARGSSTTAVTKRREGPEAEDELLFLGLL